MSDLMTGAGSSEREQPRDLAAFLRAHRAEILREWETVVRALPRARELDRPALLDHLPPLLDRIAEMAEELARGGSPTLPSAEAERHAHDRLDEGMDLAEVVAEFALLRDCVLRLYDRERRDEAHAGVLVLNQAIDLVVAASVERYIEARDRTLKALDRISAAALESSSLDELLQRLLRVFIEITAAVDTAVILLREDDRLRVRAAVGLEEDVARGFSLRVGEGFAGRIAAEKTPLQLPAAATDPLVKSEILRARGVRALFGVPLVAGGDVIGVAHMGSLTASTFSEQDQRLLRAMAERATAAIFQHRLRDDLHKTQDRLSAIIEGAVDGIVTIDERGVIQSVNRATTQLFGYEAHEVVGKNVTVLMPEPYRSEHDGYLERYRRTGERRIIGIGREVAGRRKDGSVFPLDLAVSESITARGRVFTGILRDITDRKRREEALADAAQFRERLIGILGHDLRSPLSAVLISAQSLLRRDDLAEPFAKGLARIDSAAHRMERLVSDIVDWARSHQGGAMPLSRQHIRLREVCQRVVSELEAAFPDRRILQQHADGCDGHWDPGRLAQIVSNLVGNALQYGAVEEPVRVRTEERGDHAVLEVWNAGPPIPPDALPRLFQPFQRLSAKPGSGKASVSASTS